MDIQTAKSKVAKLMAMATDGRGNEFEAEAALRQAEALMRQHGIAAADVQDRTGERPVYTWSTTFVPAGAPRPIKQSPLWFGWLITGIGQFTDTKVGYETTRENGMCASFKGDMMDVEYAVFLCKHLRDDCRAQASMFEGDRSDRESFRKAYAIRVSQRMKALLAERKAAMRAHAAGTGTALCIIDNKLILRDVEFGAQTYGRSTSHTVRANGAAAGRAAGDRAGLGRPVGHTQQARLG